MKKTSGKFLLPLFWVILFPVFLIQPLSAQQAETAADTSSADVEFEVRWLKLELIWPDLFRAENYDDLIELKLFARQAADEGNYGLALIYLDEIFRSVGPQAAAEQKEQETSVDAGANAGAETVWEKSVLWGMDFSQQQYHLTYSGQDSAILESFNNPFLGVQLRWNRYRPGRFDVTAQSSVKFSRDYLHGFGELVFEKSGVLRGKVRLQQQAEGLKYRRFFPIEYGQSLTNLEYYGTVGRHLALDLVAEAQYRHYTRESESFPTYFRESYLVQAQVLDFWNSKLYLDWQREARFHKTFAFYDFDDQRWNVQLFYQPSWKSSFSLWFQQREMRYPNLDTDSTYLADFRQEYLTGSLRQRIQERISLRSTFESIWRTYAPSALYLADYWHLRFQPGVLFEFSSKCSFGLDYLLEIKRFAKNTSAAASWLLDQSLYSEGVVLSFDFMNFKNLLISFSHTFRLNTYPDAPEDVLPGLSLYTDRFENSTMLYLSYQIFSSLNLNLILQHDLDRDREIANNDARSAIFSLDMGWKF